MEWNVTQEQPTRALLVEADTGDYDAEASLAELFELAESAGAIPVASISQKLRHIDPATCVGAGKLEEIRDYCAAEEIALLIFDLELSPVQLRNIEKETDVRVIDRTALILDIFAQRAKTKEGRLQVELAQYRYLLPRLIGMWTHLERQAGTSGKGPIGSRGPGETQLETDRRHIRRKIQKLEEELAAVRKVRSTQRRRRPRSRNALQFL